MRIFSKTALKAFIPAALLCSAAVSVSVAAQTAPVETSPVEETQTVYSPGVLLRPFYEQGGFDLPKASRNVTLDVSKPLTRIAFGSCNHQSRSQHMWAQITAQNPQLFLFIGDNIYGDSGWEGDAELTTLRDAYALQASHPEFIEFRKNVPMAVTWDDHDFGFNDGGGNFAFKEFAEEIYENFWFSSDEVKSRPGIYDSMMVGPKGQRVQIIMLDTRFFRSPLKKMEYSEERPRLGSSLPDSDPAKTVLGEAQWQWLAAELAKPADLRLVVSSIQVLTDAHGFEKWGNFPLQRERLYTALKDRVGGDIMFLSGDRHSGATYMETPPALGEPVWELTSSSLNLAFVSDDANEREPDARRKSDMITQENYGLIDIDWKKKSVTLQLRDAKSRPIVTQSVKLKK